MLNHEDKYPAFDLLPWREPESGLPWWGWLGASIMAVCQPLIFTQIEPLYTHFTLIMWWAYILLIDGIIRWRRGASLISSRPKTFAFLAIVSVPSWLIFEFVNCYLENWVYIGLPESILYRYVTYTLAFATITPALLLTYELLLTLWPPKPQLDESRKPSDVLLKAWVVFGFLCIMAPLFVASRTVRHYLFGFVWVGYVLFFEPLIYEAGGYSLLRFWYAGCRRLVLYIFASGAICGLLWEFWNFWAGAKWLYTVPILPAYRYFEMPILGFLGFLPFAWEVLVLAGVGALIWGNQTLLHPHAPAHPKRAVWNTRFVALMFLVMFLFVYAIHDKRYFPIHGFRLDGPQPLALNEPLSEKELLRLLDNVTDYTNEFEEWPFERDMPFRFWHPNNTSREVFDRFRALQTNPNFVFTQPADDWLRDYAIVSRFNWANYRVMDDWAAYPINQRP